MLMGDSPPQKKSENGSNFFMGAGIQLFLFIFLDGGPIFFFFCEAFNFLGGIGDPHIFFWEGGLVFFYYFIFIGGLNFFLGGSNFYGGDQ